MFWNRKVQARGRHEKSWGTTLLDPYVIPARSFCPDASPELEAAWVRYTLACRALDAYYDDPGTWGDPDWHVGWDQEDDDSRDGRPGVADLGPRAGVSEAAGGG